MRLRHDENDVANDLISIIVPIYNVRNYIERCVESILEQTYGALDVVLIDDCSTDGCSDVCDFFAARDARVRVIHCEENRGLVEARKIGLQKAHGKFVVYVDGDDWIESEMVESLHSAMIACDVRCVISGYCEEIAESVTEICFNSLPCGIYRGARMNELRRHLVLLNGSACFGVNTFLWGKIFYKEDLLPFQMDVDVNLSIGEDAACLYPFLMECESLYIDGSSYYHYVQHRQSMVKTAMPPEARHEKLACLQRYLELRLFPYDIQYNGLISKQIMEYMRLLARIRVPFEASPALCEVIAQKDLPNRNIVLCGAGTFGQHLSRCLAERSITVSSWIDPHYLLYRKIGMKINSMESIVGTRPDVVMVAYSERRQSAAAREWLLGNGLPESSIILL